MSSHLHARKKVYSSAMHIMDSGDVETLVATSQQQPPSSGGSGHSQKKRRYSRLALFQTQPPTSELMYAALSVAAFLVLGLSLGYFLLHHQHRRVIVHLLRDPLHHGLHVLRGRQGFRHHYYEGQPRYVTVVLPSVVNPAGRAQRLAAIQDTWGGAARAIFVGGNVSHEFPQAWPQAVWSETSQPEDKYAFPQYLALPNSIGVDDGVPRLWHTLQAILDKVDPDFALLVNDHTYIIPAHVCRYLHKRSADEEVYEGHALRNGDQSIFNSGAAGYLLSRATLKKLVATQTDPSQHPKCASGTDPNNKWLQGNPGLVTLQCLNSLGIHATDTRAQQLYHRFHAFPLTRVVSGQVDDWYHNKHKDMDQVSGGTFPASYNTLLKGPDCCAADTISFHYVEWKETKALFAVQEQLLEHPHWGDHEVRHLLQAEWPRDAKELGGYSRPLPKEKDAEGWRDLIATIRKISTRSTQRDC